MDENIKIIELAKNNNWTELEIILKKKDIDFNIQDAIGNYLIHYLILFNKPALILILLTNEIRLDVLDSEGRSILYNPIKYNYIDIFNMLINHDSIGLDIRNINDRRNIYPVTYCIYYENITCLKILLKTIKYDEIYTNGQNLLQLYIQKKMNDIRTLEFFLTPKMINHQNLYGSSSLHIATQQDDTELVKILLKYGANVNLRDKLNQTAIYYAGEKILSDILLENGTDINTQNTEGNTFFHESILIYNSKFIHSIISRRRLVGIKTYREIPENKRNEVYSVNIENNKNETIVHMLLKMKSAFVDLLLPYSRMNIQDSDNNSIVHLLFKEKLFYPNILYKKKINLYLKNNEGVIPLDYLNKGDYKIVVDIIYNVIKHKKDSFTCTGLSENSCKKKIMDLIEQKKPYLIEKNVIKKPEKMPKVLYTTYTGTSIDLLLGILYLSKKLNINNIITSKFMNSDKIVQFYKNIGYEVDTRYDFVNFEIVWLYDNIFYPDDMDEKIEEYIIGQNIFLIISIGIEISKGSHSNFLLFQKKNKRIEIERFEPFGSGYRHDFNYNSSNLDTLLSEKFSKIGKYIEPGDYLPTLGFQYRDVSENNKYKKIGDPGGFCSLWCIWWVEMRVNNKDIDRDKLSGKLMSYFKEYKISIKETIRNYSSNITDIRDKIFVSEKIDANEWINENLTNDQLNGTLRKIIQFINK